MTAKGKRERERETGRKAQASFFSLLLLLLLLSRGRKGERASRRSYTEDICHLSPLFFLFSFAFVFPSLLWPQLTVFSPSLLHSLSPDRKESDAPASQLV